MKIDQFMPVSRFARLAAILICLFSTHAFAAIDATIEFDDERARERYQGLIQELRCPKCPNQNLAGTESSIAWDLRREVARLIREGQSDAQIKEYMVNRYGEFVLYKPRMTMQNLLVWLGPVLIIAIGVLVFFFIVRSRRHHLGDEPPEDTSENT